MQLSSITRQGGRPGFWISPMPSFGLKGNAYITKSSVLRCPEYLVETTVYTGEWIPGRREGSGQREALLCLVVM